MMPLILLLVALAGASPQAERESAPDLTELFAPYTGCLVVRNVGNDTERHYNRAECRRRTIPCSTFKLPHTLIGLELGLLDDGDRRFHWDGSPQPYAAWQGDQTLASSLEYSVVWAFQRLAREVGAKRMQQWLDRLEYGNRDIHSGLDDFWLTDGSLRISPDEQVSFLARLVRHDLPVSRRSMWALQAAIPKVAPDTFGKTGTGKQGEEEIGWFVGYRYFRDGREYVFAVRIRGAGAGGKAARRIALAALDRPEVVPASDPDTALSFCGQSFHRSTRSLYCADQGTATLEALRELSWLEEVEVRLSTALRDVSGLVGLTRLRRLSFYESAVVDIRPLASLPDLVELDLCRTQVKDLRPLRKLTKLKVLDLTGVPASDMAPLASLHQLEELTVDGERTSDLVPLADLPALRLLRLSGNGPGDLRPLAHQPALTTLELSDSGSLDLAPLASAPALRHVLLDLWEGSNLAPLGGQRELRTLRVQGSGVPELARAEWLAQLPLLERLELDNVHLATAEPLAGLTQLRELSLWSNPLTSIAPLASLTELESLNLGQNGGITDGMPLASLHKLRHLSLPCRLADLGFLEHLPALEELRVCRLDGLDLTPLARLRHLASLDISTRGTLDLRPLKGLPAMERLVVRDAAVPDGSWRVLATWPHLKSVRTQCVEIPADIRKLLLENRPGLELRKVHCPRR